MALPQVTIELQNGAIGTVVTSPDNVMGMVMNGVATSGVVLGTSYVVFSLAEAVALGITAAYDTTNGVGVYRNIKEFYDEAGKGAELWLMLVSQAVTVESICDKTNAFAQKMLDDAGGRIKVLGVVRNPASGYAPNVTANGFDVDIANAMSKAQVLAEQSRADFQPVRIVLDAYAYNGTASAVKNLRQDTKNSVALLLGGTVSGKNSVGLLLGRLSKIPVQRNIGRTKDSALAITAAYVGTALVTDTNTVLLHDKGYITFRKFKRKSGWYWNDDPTAAAVTDDYAQLARGRVIDKAITIAYDTYVQEVQDEIEVDTVTGKLEPAKAKYFQRIIETAIETAMVANGNITSVRAFIDVNQNVLATNKTIIELRLVPVAYNKEISVKLGFENPANV